MATSAPARVRIQTEDFDLGQEMRRLRAHDPEVGAALGFVGIVREQGKPGEAAVTMLELEHYPGMTESSIEALIDEAHRRFEFRSACVIHRVGRLLPQDQIVMVAVTAAHRGAAFQAGEFLMDALKTNAPFWKKEHAGGAAHWVAARESDEAALARWGAAYARPGRDGA